MGFMSGYTPVEAMVLDNGEYQATITKVERAFYGNSNEYWKVSLTVDGKKGYSPNSYVINSRPVLNAPMANGKTVDETMVKRWDREMTTFFDSFGIQRGDYTLEGAIQRWTGKRGYVKVAEQYDPAEPDKKSKRFKQFFPFVPKDQKEAAKAKENTPSTAAFPEDIPYKQEQDSKPNDMFF